MSASVGYAPVSLSADDAENDDAGEAGPMHNREGPHSHAVEGETNALGSCLPLLRSSLGRSSRLRTRRDLLIPLAHPSVVSFVPLVR